MDDFTVPGKPKPVVAVPPLTPPNQPTTGLPDDLSYTKPQPAPSGTIGSKVEVTSNTNATIADEFKQVQYYPKFEIKPGDLDRFFDCIIDERGYTEEVKLYDGKMTVILRTRTMREANTIMLRIGRDTPSSVAEMEIRLASFNLAYALVSIKTSKQVRNYDIDGDLSARLALQESIQAPHFLTLIQHMFAFDDKVNQLRQLAVKKTS